MTKIKNLAGLAACGLILGISQISQAAVIDFNSHSPALDGSNPIFDSGFRFDFNASGWGVFGPGSGACCNVNYNGTTSLFADGDKHGKNASSLMTPTTGGTFSIFSLDASVYWTGATGTLDIIGNLFGGGTVTTSLSISSTWQNFLLPGTFTNLVSVEFRDSQSGSFLSAPGFGVDNINITPVPEPETYAMLLAGLGLLSLMVRRRNESAA
ncbi:FxDxF family PEP-CTERM protein [Nitrosomonas sp.]|uniref:FxDxF family PEP-CTERM protein n=1 Tax=Nitrosomonas sp. TaxID=42353 RepID=UPI001D99FDC3|nr:FxDxF family PEP-CTERM protein [Nitrosomonas sp.]MBX3616948.1 FxDxF family PEP-CTERM protein [Nitrosomonas sp.]